MLGIGVITYNRLEGLIGCVEGVQNNTSCPYELVVASDGSTDGTVKWCRDNAIDVIGRTNLGNACNTNRALSHLYHSGCDPIITIEEDCHPYVYGWERDWIKAAGLFKHINYGFLLPFGAVDGSGVGYEPLRCLYWGTQCVANSRSALSTVGYQDPRFYGVRYPGAHGEWSGRMERWLKWPKHDGRSAAPCLRSGLKIVDLGTYHNAKDIERSGEIQSAIPMTEPLYRSPWRNEVQKKLFLSECESW